MSNEQTSTTATRVSSPDFADLVMDWIIFLAAALLVLSFVGIFLLARPEQNQPERDETLEKPHLSTASECEKDFLKVTLINRAAYGGPLTTRDLKDAAAFCASNSVLARQIELLR